MIIRVTPTVDTIMDMDTTATATIT
jgi:hypothetical protein